MEKVTVRVCCAVCGVDAEREVTWVHKHRVKFCSTRCCNIDRGRRARSRSRKPKATLEERLRSRLARNSETGCLEWTGATRPGGYGAIRLGAPQRSSAPTHRVAYELWVGGIPVGLELDHLCFNPACCEPSHLEPVTHAENMRRMRERQKQLAELAL
ncbi:HNH endonuclease signature motif containing protein [Streptomyces sp. A3M-1-3]|uniref:HNH endonuclease signature motif containing protein n=1 Tax=Streptomyces sp. A3M-1-3 TaxID=2962044 RepID=UPI0035AC1EC1